MFDLGEHGGAAPLPHNIENNFSYVPPMSIFLSRLYSVDNWIELLH